MSGCSSGSECWVSELVRKVTTWNGEFLGHLSSGGFPSDCPSFRALPGAAGVSDESDEVRAVRFALEELRASSGDEFLAAVSCSHGVHRDGGDEALSRLALRIDELMEARS